MYLLAKPIESHSVLQRLRSKDGNVTILIVCVDDMIPIGDDVAEMEALKKILAKEKSNNSDS